jgi:superfamily II DNA/RNA helicase
LVQSSLVFADSKELPTLVNPVSQQGFNLGVVSEHSGRHERREALRIERTELLLATDVLARGMDLKSLTHVVNYAPTPTPNVYLHRAGRVGRLGALHSKLGSVVTLVDLLADPRALEHLQKVSTTLGLEFARIYVKKGKLFEDGAESSRVAKDQLPSIEPLHVCPPHSPSALTPPVLNHSALDGEEVKSATRSFSQRHQRSDSESPARAVERITGERNARRYAAYSCMHAHLRAVDHYRATSFRRTS